MRIGNQLKHSVRYLLPLICSQKFLHYIWFSNDTHCTCWKRDGYQILKCLYSHLVTSTACLILQGLDIFKLLLKYRELCFMKIIRKCAGQHEHNMQYELVNYFLNKSNSFFFINRWKNTHNELSNWNKPQQNKKLYKLERNTSPDKYVIANITLQLSDYDDNNNTKGHT